MSRTLHLYVIFGFKSYRGTRVPVDVKSLAATPTVNVEDCASLRLHTHQLSHGTLGCVSQ